MSFRTDTPVRKTRKNKTCRWCSQRVEVGAPSVRVRGAAEDGYFTARFHPECWRADVNEWWKDYPDGWPEETMERGRCTESGDASGILWSSAPVSNEEAANHRLFADRMKEAQP